MSLVELDISNYLLTKTDKKLVIDMHVLFSCFDNSILPFTIHPFLIPFFQVSPQLLRPESSDLSSNLPMMR